MTEFETLVLEQLKIIHNDVSELKKDVSSMKDDIEELKENAEITRTSVNYTGEKLDELVTLLNQTNVVTFKY